jgi:CheY-like chemotaxis protein
MMGKLLILSENPEIREIMSQEFTGEGHVVIATGNPRLMPELLWNFAPDLLLIDFHLNKGNPWQMMQKIRKDSPRTFVLPYTAYPGFDGNLRLVIAHPNGGKNLTLQAFKEQLDSFMNPGFIPGDGKSVNYGSPGQKPGGENSSVPFPREQRTDSTTIHIYNEEDSKMKSGS